MFFLVDRRERVFKPVFRNGPHVECACDGMPAPTREKTTERGKKKKESQIGQNTERTH